MGSRINEHIYQPSDKTTTSLKLKAHTQLVGEAFRVSWISLNVDHYDLIVPLIERRLRNRFYPVIDDNSLVFRRGNAAAVIDAYTPIISCLH